jgi:hypothetical protein
VLGPADASLAGEARLIFKASDLSSGSRLRTGVYSYDMEAGVWLFAGAQRTGDRISASVRRFGAYALREDESPPRITATTPARGAAVRARRPLTVQARVVEKGEGLGPDGVLFLLDGRPVESEFDPDRGLARGVQIPSLPAGPHRLQVRATDLAGNVSQTLTVDFSAR